MYGGFILSSFQSFLGTEDLLQVFLLKKRTTALKKRKIENISCFPNKRFPYKLYPVGVRENIQELSK